ncbi:hypothetical protein KKG72_04745 [bacterium]|nr:hypothetical protein [bacterium]
MITIIPGRKTKTKELFDTIKEIESICELAKYQLNKNDDMSHFNISRMRTLVKELQEIYLEKRGKKKEEST